MKKGRKGEEEMEKEEAREDQAEEKETIIITPMKVLEIVDVEVKIASNR